MEFTELVDWLLQRDGIDPDSATSEQLTAARVMAFKYVETGSKKGQA